MKIDTIDKALGASEMTLRILSLFNIKNDNYIIQKITNEFNKAEEEFQKELDKQEIK